MQLRGLEPLPKYMDMNLNHARMPIPPQLHIYLYCIDKRTVRATGLEPARRGHRFLRPTRLPFRHARMDIKYSIKKPRCQSYYRQKKPSCRFFIYRGILRRCFSEYFPDVKTNTGFFTKKRPKISTKLPKTLDSADLL